MKKKWIVCLMALMIAIGGAGCDNTVAKAATGGATKLPAQETPKKEPTQSAPKKESAPSAPRKEPVRTQGVGEKVSMIEYEGNLAYVLEYPKTGNVSVDEAILGIVGEIRRDFAAAYGTKDEMQKRKSSQKDCDTFLYLTYDTYLVSEDQMSLVFHETREVNTVLSSIHKVQIYHFNMTTGEMVEETAYIKEGFRDGASRFAITYFTETQPYKEDIYGNYGKTLAPAEGRFDRFALTAEGVLFYFDPYDIFPGRYGIVSLLVPYEALRGTLHGVGLEALPVAEETITAPSVSGPGGAVRREIDPTKPMVALTFDDGPNPKNTGRILDTLEKYGTVATFFDLGNLVSAYPETVRREIALGCEVGSHSYSHKNFNKLTKAEILADVRATANAFQEAAEFEPTLFRPPYGNADEKVKAVMPLAMVTWSVDTLDWKSKNVNEIMKIVKAEADLDGRVILMHGIYETSAQATEKIIPYLLAEGYQLVTVSELLQYKHNVTPEGGTYYGYEYFQ